MTDVTATPLSDGNYPTEEVGWAVEISWTPPVHLGSVGQIEHYVVQWGFIEYIMPGMANPQLDQEGRQIAAWVSEQTISLLLLTLPKLPSNAIQMGQAPKAVWAATRIYTPSCVFVIAHY